MTAAAIPPSALPRIGALLRMISQCNDKRYFHICRATTFMAMFPRY